MGPVALIICAAITLAAAWFIAKPLLAAPGVAPGGPGDPNDPGEDPAHLLKVERDILYQAIHELDLDYAAGKLSEADYRVLRARYEAQAVDLLKAIDAATGTAASSSSPRAMS